jgi:hypothetical protein
MFSLLVKFSFVKKFKWHVCQQKKRDSLKMRQIMHVMEIEENVKHDNLLKYYEDAKNKKLH